jgi:elongation factor P
MRATEVKPGMILEVEKEPWQVTSYEHVTPGKGHAIIHVKLRNVINGRTQALRLSSSDKVEKAYVEKRSMEYLYEDASGYIFMDNESFEQNPLPKDAFAEQMRFVKLNSPVNVLYYGGEAISIELTPSVVLEVTETQPGEKGDSVNNVTKPAVLETGLEVKVPLFINEGDKLKIDTRSGEYLERSK